MATSWVTLVLRSSLTIEASMKWLYFDSNFIEAKIILFNSCRLDRCREKRSTMACHRNEIDGDGRKYTRNYPLLTSCFSKTVPDPWRLWSWTRRRRIWRWRRFWRLWVFRRKEVWRGWRRVSCPRLWVFLTPWDADWSRARSWPPSALERFPGSYRRDSRGIPRAR